MVVDVGGATTDVYSVTSPETDESPAEHDVVATMWRSRTVEGDLGVRWNAPGIVEAAEREGLLTAAERDSLRQAAQRRHADPGLVPTSDEEREIDRTLARLAATIALRRHAKPHQAGQVSYPGKNLSQVRLVVGSGGVLRHSEPRLARALVRDAIDDPEGGWRVPERATTAVDFQYVLAAAGLLSRNHRAVATQLLSRSLRNR